MEDKVSITILAALLSLDADDKQYLLKDLKPIMINKDNSNYLNNKNNIIWIIIVIIVICFILLIIFYFFNSKESKNKKMPINK